jgi:hypothetical protein
MKLAKFAMSLMGEWPDIGEWDPFELQELATECGILLPQDRTTFCDDPETETGPVCNCREYMSDSEAAVGFKCYRMNAALAVQAKADEGPTR